MQTLGQTCSASVRSALLANSKDWAKWRFYLQQKVVRLMSFSLLSACVGCRCPLVLPADLGVGLLSTGNPKKMLLPLSEMGPWVPPEYWLWSYARNPLFALPSLLQVGRAFKDPVHGSVGTAGSLFGSRCSQEWSRRSSAGANFRSLNIAGVPLSPYLCVILWLPAKSHVRVPYPCV